VIQIPTIVGRQGSLIGFKAMLPKTWTHKHEKRSLLYASCPGGHLFAHGEFDFVDEMKISGDTVKACTPGR
jgi:hypothetical protein